MSSVIQRGGLFGKLPQQPDFISHNLPADFTTPLHQWLQNVTAISGEQLGDRVGLSEPESCAGTVFGLADAISRQLTGAHSLWWTRGSQQVAPVLLICTGLPEPGRFAAMLDGGWQQRGWSVTAPERVGSSA